MSDSAISTAFVDELNCLPSRTLIALFFGIQRGLVSDGMIQNIPQNTSMSIVLFWLLVVLVLEFYP